MTGMFLLIVQKCTFILPPLFSRQNDRVAAIFKWSTNGKMLFVYLSTNEFQIKICIPMSTVTLKLNFIQLSRPSYVSTYLNFLTVQIVQCLHVSIYRLLNTWISIIVSYVYLSISASDNSGVKRRT